MQLGYFTMPLHPPERDYTETLREDREAIILADRLGYAEAFVGEHVTDRAETITSCLVFIASLIGETRRIKLGSGTVNLPNSHPAAVAAQVAMLDHLLQGRFLFGISPGGLRSDAEVFGNLDKDRTAMFVEAIDMVLKIWSTDPPYNLEGKFWKVTTERTLDRQIGQGVMVEALSAAASADRRHRGGALLQGRRRRGRARLDADLGQLPAAALGRLALADVRAGLQERRPPGATFRLAHRQERVRRRRRGDWRAAMQRARAAPIASTTATS